MKSPLMRSALCHVRRLSRGLGHGVGAAGLSLLLSSASVAQIIQPATYHSPSKSCVLRVEPDNRFGTGSSTYTMWVGGNPAWKRNHPFTLYEAYVGDNGHVAGYAYEGAQRDSCSGGSLSVVLLSPV